jgi:hypothetical protein
MVFPEAVLTVSRTLSPSQKVVLPVALMVPVAGRLACTLTSPAAEMQLLPSTRALTL